MGRRNSNDAISDALSHRRRGARLPTTIQQFFRSKTMSRSSVVCGYFERSNRCRRQRRRTPHQQKDTYGNASSPPRSDLTEVEPIRQSIKPSSILRVSPGFFGLGGHRSHLLDISIDHRLKVWLIDQLFGCCQDVNRLVSSTSLAIQPGNLHVDLSP